MNKPCPTIPEGYLVKFAMLLVVLIFISACAYRHYLGMHGPSVKQFPQVHAGFTEDKACLMCHDPGSSATSPKTGHPNFKGCLKCHNDDMSSND